MGEQEGPVRGELVTQKPPWELREGEERVLPTLSDQAMYDHLTRPEPRTEKKFEKLHAGLYPLLLDDTCQLLACDFHRIWARVPYSRADARSSSSSTPGTSRSR
ncbi:hypothetical protein [Streptacidiphilus sp. EB103A]|uniref:TOTE conflict system archaeo-eukaryotic primase domain-containing protein n=1 Tax=Streptacidiphilus sp. EB103A TaxID=3156275 RepID=UPI00351563EC